MKPKVFVKKIIFNDGTQLPLRHNSEKNIFRLIWETYYSFAFIDQAFSVLIEEAVVFSDETVKMIFYSGKDDSINMLQKSWFITKHSLRAFQEYMHLEIMKPVKAWQKIRIGTWKPLSAIASKIWGSSINILKLLRQTLILLVQLSIMEQHT